MSSKNEDFSENMGDEVHDVDEAQYAAVSTASLIHRKSALADLYLKLPSGRIFKIAHKNVMLDAKRLTSLNEKNVKYLYVKKADLAAIVSEFVRNAAALNKMDNVPVDLKAVKFVNLSETVFTELLKLPLSPESLTRATQFTKEMTVTMIQQPDFIKLFGTIITMSDEFAKHSMGCVLLSNLLAKQLGWESPKMLGTLTMGAFLHDIGKRELPPELLNKKRIDMTKEEVQLYYTHPNLGAQILSSVSTISTDVLRIVQEHHELPNGCGFPSRIRGERMYPPAKVVSLANTLSHDFFDFAIPPKKIDFDKVREKVDTVYATMYGAELTKALRNLFKDE